MHINISFWILFSFFSTPSNDTPPKLLWSDEFNDELSQREWTFDEGNGCPGLCGWGNNELQYYTGDQKNVRVKDGVLIIEAHKQEMKESSYTSARIKTVAPNSWKYGYIEIRAKLPEGRGTWPALWMLPDSLVYGGWPTSGEIDIMEHVGYDPGVVHGTVHTLDFNHIKGTQIGKQRKVENFQTEFHTYAVNWTADEIEFYIDGEHYHTFKNNGNGLSAWPFDHHFHVVINIAVGGGWGGAKGVDENIWPQRMEVDYVRVYEPLLTTYHKTFFVKK
ncbi:MAG TPA: glycoside hydrolase family 16 protein [Ohtaekwangia sp.]|nr:glycoside hydrolase family 16 protein [Ohtaekwangia sp.]